MRKAIALAVIILWALASMAGYLYLTGKITAGKRQIAVGQNKVDKGQTALDEGKVELEAGKQELSEGKKEYEHAKDSWLLVFADACFPYDGENIDLTMPALLNTRRLIAEAEIWRYT
jgi:hypothetical protein